MKTETQKLIEAAEAIEAATHMAYSDAREEVVRLKKQFAEETFQIRQGSLVEMRGKTTFKVIGVDTFTHPRKPWVNGVMKKKDGSFMERSQCLYADWELIDPTPSAAKP